MHPNIPLLVILHVSNLRHRQALIRPIIPFAQERRHLDHLGRRAAFHASPAGFALFLLFLVPEVLVVAHAQLQDFSRAACSLPGAYIAFSPVSC